MTDGERKDVVVVVTRDGATLSGIVTDAHGRPVRQGVVVVFPVQEALWSSFGYTPPRIRVTPFFGERGYVCEGLPQGDYYVVAVDGALAEAWHDPSFFSTAQPVATRVTLAWGATQPLNLEVSAVDNR